MLWILCIWLVLSNYFEWRPRWRRLVACGIAKEIVINFFWGWWREASRWRCLSIHSFSSCAKTSSFVKREIGLQTLGCIFLTEFLYCFVNTSPLFVCSWHIVTYILVDNSEVLWKMWVQLYAFEALSFFLLQCSVFQNKKPVLGADHHHPSAHWSHQ